MGFIFTEHITEKFDSRPFSSELINPDKIEHQSDWKILHTKLDWDIVHRLVFRYSWKDIVLITYYFSSKVSKYL